MPRNACTVAPFVQTLAALVDSTDVPSIRWTTAGDAIVIEPVDEFSAQVLPVVFGHKSIANFTRQLNYHDFYSCTVGTSAVAAGTDLDSLTQAQIDAMNAEKNKRARKAGKKKSRKAQKLVYAHPYFKRGHAEMLPRITRRTNTTASAALAAQRAAREENARQKALAENAHSKSGTAARFCANPWNQDGSSDKSDVSPASSDKSSIGGSSRSSNSDYSTANSKSHQTPSVYSTYRTNAFSHTNYANVTSSMISPLDQLQQSDAVGSTMPFKNKNSLSLQLSSPDSECSPNTIGLESLQSASTISPAAASYMSTNGPASNISMGAESDVCNPSVRNDSEYHKPYTSSTTANMNINSASFRNVSSMNNVSVSHDLQSQANAMPQLQNGQNTTTQLSLADAIKSGAQVIMTPQGPALIVPTATSQGSDGNMQFMLFMLPPNMQQNLAAHLGTNLAGGLQTTGNLASVSTGGNQYSMSAAVSVPNTSLKGTTSNEPTTNKLHPSAQEFAPFAACDKRGNVKTEQLSIRTSKTPHTSDEDVPTEHKHSTRKRSIDHYPHELDNSHKRARRDTTSDPAFEEPSSNVGGTGIADGFLDTPSIWGLTPHNQSTAHKDISGPSLLRNNSGFGLSFPALQSPAVPTNPLRAISNFSSTGHATDAPLLRTASFMHSFSDILNTPGGIDSRGPLRAPSLGGMDLQQLPISPRVMRTFSDMWTSIATPSSPGQILQNDHSQIGAENGSVFSSGKMLDAQHNRATAMC